MTKRGICLDLDGTVLHIDAGSFFRAYLYMLASCFPGVEQDRFVGQLLASTKAMVNSNDPSLTNREVFNADFFPKVGLDPDETVPMLERFYRDEFPKLERFGRPKPEARDLIEYALEEGMQVIVATNPIFPRVAVSERLRWAGLDDLPFDLITSYEIMHFCKPHLGYYREILDITGLEASQCFMVGNDVEEDMAAARLGMEAFLVTDQVIPREDGLPWHGPQGSLEDFLVRLRDGGRTT